MRRDLANTNTVVRDSWSSPGSRQLYIDGWPTEPAIRQRYESGEQCGCCAFYAPFNYDWGLCCRSSSRHVSETVFEHFTCPEYEHEGWGPHSFKTSAQRILLAEAFGDDGTA
jgi:hypothetical protein